MRPLAFTYAEEFFRLNSNTAVLPAAIATDRVGTETTPVPSATMVDAVGAQETVMEDEWPFVNSMNVVLLPKTNSSPPEAVAVNGAATPALVPTTGVIVAIAEIPF